MDHHPSTPGFGYIAIGQAHDAKFVQIGKYHASSVLPHMEEDAVKATTLCVFLGPGRSQFYAL